MLHEIALNRLAPLLQLRGRDRQVDGAARRHRVGRRWHDSFKQVADVVRQIVELQPEILLGIGTENLVELAHLPGGGVFLEELVAEKRLQLRGMLLRWTGVLSTLKRRALSRTRMPP